MRSLSRLTLAVLLALTAGLAACSSDDEDPDAADETTEEDDSSSDAEEDDADDEEEEEEVDEEEVDDASDVLPDEALPYVDALMASFLEDESSTPIDDAQAECVSTRIVLIVGADRLVDSGVTPEAFAAEPNLAQLGLGLDAGLQAYDAFDACGINFRELTLAAFAAESDDPAAVEACLENVADDEAFRQFFARSLVEGTEFEDSPEAAEFFNQLFACTTVEG
jgi:hypothetical protein